ncbi:hypothetical protein [Schleiferilactobacillus harbinensis]|uniref:hypothetical protein n=1 Tax=Schleiferilactobacillus harbinensis TaxID=304207 RepID=UPI00345E41EA
MDNRSVVPLVPYGREYSLEVTQAELKQLGADSTNTFEKVVDSVKGTITYRKLPSTAHEDFVKKGMKYYNENSQMMEDLKDM